MGFGTHWINTSQVLARDVLKPLAPNHRVLAVSCGYDSELGLLLGQGARLCVKGAAAG